MAKAGHWETEKAGSSAQAVSTALCMSQETDAEQRNWRIRFRCKRLSGDKCATAESRGSFWDSLFLRRDFGCSHDSKGHGCFFMRRRYLLAYLSGREGLSGKGETYGKEQKGHVEEANPHLPQHLPGRPAGLQRGELGGGEGVGSDTESGFGGVRLIGYLQGSGDGIVTLCGCLSQPVDRRPEVGAPRKAGLFEMGAFDPARDAFAMEGEEL